MNQTLLRGSETIYACLLKFYPKSYRLEFGEEMQFVFSESLKDACAAKGSPGMLALWARTALDTGSSLLTQHLENLKGDEAMKTNQDQPLTQYKTIIRIVIATALILMVPLIGMQFSNEVNWSLMDFATAGGLLLGTGLLFVLLTRQVSELKTRLIIGGVLLALLFVVWVELAVGIFH